MIFGVTLRMWDFWLFVNSSTGRAQYLVSNPASAISYQPWFAKL
jgi:hypothetical protein